MYQRWTHLSIGLAFLVLGLGWLPAATACPGSTASDPHRGLLASRVGLAHDLVVHYVPGADTPSRWLIVIEAVEDLLSDLATVSQDPALTTDELAHLTDSQAHLSAFVRSSRPDPRSAASRLLSLWQGLAKAHRLSRSLGR